MSDVLEQEEDKMFIVYDPVTTQITQLVYSAGNLGLWTRIDGEWFFLSEDDMSALVLKKKYIARRYFLEARDYFDDQTEQNVLMYEPEYRMWYA